MAARHKYKYKESLIEVVNGFTYVGVFFANRLCPKWQLKAKMVLYILHYTNHLGTIPYRTCFIVYSLFRVIIPI